MTDSQLQKLLDIEAIKQLKYRYCALCDNDYDPDGLAALFTEDAVWEGGQLGRAKGRDQIRQYFADASNAVAFAMHAVMNPTIDVNGSQATGSWYLWQPMVYRSKKNDVAFWLNARYEDTYVKRSDKWLISSTRVEVRMLAPYHSGFAAERIARPPRE